MLRKPLKKKKNNKAKRMKLLKPMAITEAATDRERERERQQGRPSVKLKLKQTKCVKYAKQYKRHFVDGLLCVRVVALDSLLLLLLLLLVL